MSQSEDMDALNKYFLTQAKAVTPEATQVKNAWSAWYNALGFYDRDWNSHVYDEARSRRNQFNLANAKTPAEKATVVRVMTTGMSTEEMQGKSKPKINPVTGAVGTQNARDEAATKGDKLPTIKQGSSGKKGTPIGDAVIKWQTFLAIKADGNFGAGTKTATVAWQKAHALPPDGVVGPKTWASAFQAAPAAKDIPSPVASFVSAITPDFLMPVSLPVPAAKPAQTPEAKKAYTGAVAAAKAAPAKTAPAKGAQTGGMTPQSTAIETPKVAQAGMLTFIKDMPIWGWLALGAGTIVAVKTGVVKPASLSSSKKRRR